MPCGAFNSRPSTRFGLVVLNVLMFGVEIRAGGSEDLDTLFRLGAMVPAAIRHGEVWVKRLAEDPKTRDEAQTTLEKWYIRTMNIFGRPGSPKNALYRRYRLKIRDNDEVRSAFASEVKDKAATVGLSVPEWTPVWERLPEEAQIPG